MPCIFANTLKQKRTNPEKMEHKTSQVPAVKRYATHRSKQPSQRFSAQKKIMKKSTFPYVGRKKAAKTGQKADGRACCMNVWVCQCVCVCVCIALIRCSKHSAPSRLTMLAPAFAHVCVCVSGCWGKFCGYSKRCTFCGEWICSLDFCCCYATLLLYVC